MATSTTVNENDGAFMVCITALDEFEGSKTLFISTVPGNSAQG